MRTAIRSRDEAGLGTTLAALLGTIRQRMTRGCRAVRRCLLRDRLRALARRDPPRSCRRTSCSATSARRTCSTGASRVLGNRNPGSTSRAAARRRRRHASRRDTGHRVTCLGAGARRDGRFRDGRLRALGCVLFEILAGKPALSRGVAAIGTLSSSIIVERARGRRGAGADDRACSRPSRRRAVDHGAARRPYPGPPRWRSRSGTSARSRGSARTAPPRRRPQTEDSRTIAMREAGRALALDPSNATAQRILAGMMLATPRTVPPQAIATADAERGRTRQRVLRAAGRGYFVMIAAVAVLILLPVRQRWLFGVTAGLALVTGLTRRVARHPLPMRSPSFVVLLLLNCTLIAMSGVLFTPLLVMPLFLIASLTGWLQQPTTYNRGSSSPHAVPPSRSWLSGRRAAVDVSSRARCARRRPVGDRPDAGHHSSHLRRHVPVAGAHDNHRDTQQPLLAGARAESPARAGLASASAPAQLGRAGS